MNIQEIAKTLDVSRFRVSRYLCEARENGLISFTFNESDIDFEAKAIELEELFELKQVIVAPVTADIDRNGIRCAIGKAGAQIFTKDNFYRSLAISWGRTIAYAVEEIPKEVESSIESVVEISGSVGTITSSMSAHSVGLAAAENLNAHCIQLPAPVIADSPETVRILCRETMIRRALNMAETCDLVISGVGPVHDKDSNYIAVGFLTEQDIVMLEEAGAIGSIFGRFFDKDGTECLTEFRDRAVSISWENYLKIPNRGVMAGGSHKVESIYTLARNGIITLLATDSITAEMLLDKIKKEKNIT